MQVAAPFSSFAFGAAARVVIDGQLRYRRSFPLVFERDALAERLVFDPAEMQFKVTAASQRVNLLAAGSSIVAQTRALDAHTLAVSLERPYAVDRVVLKSAGSVKASAALPNTKAKARAMGVIADTTVADTTVSDAVDVIVGVHLAQQVELYRLDGDALAESATVETYAGGTVEGFVAKDFAVRVRTSGGELMSIGAGDFSSIDVRAYPTGVRFGLCPPVAPGGLAEPDELFFHAAGELGAIALDHALNQSGASALQAALERFASARFAPGSDTPFIITLLVEADAPCSVSLAEFAMSYHLSTRATLRDATGAALDKQVLRFAGEQLESQMLPLLVPPDGASIRRASLALEAAFGSASLEYLQAGAPAADSCRRGFELQSTSFAACRLDLTAGRAADGVLIGIHNLSPNTELSMVLRDDRDGTPSGADLVEVVLGAGGVGQRTWLRCGFPSTLALLAKPYWVLVRAQRGRALWLMDGDPAASVLTVPLPSVSSGSAGPVTEARVDGLRPRAVLYSRTTLGPGVAPVSLRAGASGLSLMAAGQGWSVDLLAAVGVALTGEVPLQLTFASALPGLVTVYPLELEYDP